MNELKKNFNKKMEVSPSLNFDVTFAKKLQNQQVSKKTWLKKWVLASGSVFAVFFVFLFSVQLYNEKAYPHHQYINTLLELEEYSDELATEEINGMIDLTTMDSDEI